MRKLKYDPDVIRSVCSESNSMSEAARKLNIRFSTFKRIALEVGCYDPHPEFMPAGSGANRLNAADIAELFLSNKRIVSPSKLRKLLIREGIKEYRCEGCGNTEWRGKPIPLELHHIDGNRYNNNIDNLMVLCPTCHSWETSASNHTEADRKRVSVEDGITTNPYPKPNKLIRIKRDKLTLTCACCGKTFSAKKKTKQFCSYNCAHEAGRKFNPTAEELLGVLQQTPNYTEVGKLFGVSANAVKKRCKHLGIFDEVTKMIREAKATRAKANIAKQDRSTAHAKAVQARKQNVDYFVAYKLSIDGAEEVLRYSTQAELESAGHCYKAVCRACNGSAKTYKGLAWRREPKRYQTL